MSLSHKSSSRSSWGTRVRHAVSAVTLACVSLNTLGGLGALGALGALGWSVQSACADSSRDRGQWTSSQRYPAAFRLFMEINYGRMWAHTVQEQVVLRIYARWLDKSSKTDR
ncbi:MAG: hypothetical protein EXS15_03235 [Phycisphaerales bacterium]|nr:hypothetical protein [Phycisphaerales bacterium]